MKFTISSSVLSQTLQQVGKVISSKSPLPILDYFLFSLSGQELKVTASDVETTLQSTLSVENSGNEDGLVAIPARRILDSIKEFAEQPLTITVDQSSWEIVISWSSGKLSIPGVTGVGYPELAEVDGAGSTTYTITSGLLGDGVATTIFATADDTLRPVMNGVNVSLSSSDITFVATDAHRLVRFISTATKGTTEEPTSFILPSKPANLLRTILPKNSAESIEVQYDAKNVIFTMESHKLICRLIEGNFPNYKAVIPTNNNNKLSVDRLEFMAAIRRVSVCSSQTSGLIRLNLTNKGITITAQDIDYNTSAEDNIKCEYSGDAMEIGFKAPFLIDILSNIHTAEVLIELSDPARPGLFMPVDAEDETTSVLMLLMPMMINV